VDVLETEVEMFRLLPLTAAYLLVLATLTLAYAAIPT
jgi:hypothetical protein